MLKTGDVAACHVMCVELCLGSACPCVTRTDSCACVGIDN